MSTTVTSEAGNADVISTQVAGLDSRTLVGEILQFRGRFRLDFTREFLESLPDKRLRHILLAARLQQSQPAR